MVVPFDVTASREIINLRMLLEAELVRGAVERLTSANADELRSLADEFEDAAKKRDGSTARAVNYRLHAAVDHTQLLQQMIAGDVPGATQTTRAHIKSGWEELLEAASA